MTSYNTVFADGWVELGDSIFMSSAYWLDGFPPIEDEEDRALHGRGPDGRRSPILDYQHGGIGHITWVNTTHDKAAILCANGTWKTGGGFHLWISAGARTKPFQVEWQQPVTYPAGDPDQWQVAKQRAAELARAYLGLRPTNHSA